MIYKACSACGKFTEFDEKSCPDCGNNSFGEKRYSREELIDGIAKGSIDPGRLKIKYWSETSSLNSDLQFLIYHD